jgi:hypothetical protein
MALLIPEVATHSAHIQVKVLRIIQDGATKIFYRNSGRNLNSTQRHTRMALPKFATEFLTETKLCKDVSANFE